MNATSSSPTDLAGDPAQVIERVRSRAHETHTALAGGKRMVWRRWGAGRPLLLLHGGAGGWQHWIRNIDTLAATRAVWIPDMPGFGDSDMPDGEHDADTLAPLVLAGALQVLQGERFDLAGFSFGSLVASAIAASNPATLDRLVLVSASALGLFQQQPALKSLRGATTAEEREAILRFNLNSMMLHDAARIDALAVAVQERIAVRDRVKNRKLARTDWLLTLAPQWRVPAWGIWGENDFAYLNRQDELAERIARLGLRGHTIIPGAGHWVQYEAPDAFHNALQGCLAAPT